MERHRIHRLVVVDDLDETIPIGLLSMTDLIHAIAEETATLAAGPATAAPPASSGNGTNPEATDA
jgi:CBS domain-containing protein